MPGREPCWSAGCRGTDHTPSLQACSRGLGLLCLGGGGLVQERLSGPEPDPWPGNVLHVRRGDGRSCAEVGQPLLADLPVGRQRAVLGLLPFLSCRVVTVRGSQLLPWVPGPAVHPEGWCWALGRVLIGRGQWPQCLEGMWGRSRALQPPSDRGHCARGWAPGDLCRVSVLGAPAAPLPL